LIDKAFREGIRREELEKPAPVDKRAFSPHVRWTNDEVAVVCERYETADWRELLAALPGRSKSQIQNKANSLKLSRERAPRMDSEERRRRKREGMSAIREDPERRKAIIARQKEIYHASGGERNKKRHRRRRDKNFFSYRADRYRTVSAQDLAALWKRQRGRCALTGRRLDKTAHLDHIVPRAKGGTDNIENLRWVCDEVNLAKRDLSDQDFIQLCRDVLAIAADKGQPHACR
jgi:5-methylcytosine-specific restriction endonuclease McrA